MAGSDNASNNSGDNGPLSLKRLTAAFAQMLGAKPAEDAGGDEGAEPGTPRPKSVRDPCEISPRSVVEAVLFVGSGGADSLTADQLAEAMRGVTPAEVEAAVDELNADYSRDDAPYRITRQSGGYRLTLRPELAGVRNKFYGRAKEAKLTPAAMEVLSVVAYRQPVTLERVDRLRGGRSSSQLASLVRRGLVRIHRPADGGDPHYQTTDRFLRVFHLDAADQLPRVAEMEG